MEVALVSPDATLMDLASDVLTRAGLRPQRARVDDLTAHFLEGLLAAQRADVVVIDCPFPFHGRSGLIRSWSRIAAAHGRAVVVAVTGLAAVGARAGLADGFELLAKPFGPESLVAATLAAAQRVQATRTRGATR